MPLLARYGTDFSSRIQWTFRSIPAFRIRRSLHIPARYAETLWLSSPCRSASSFSSTPARGGRWYRRLSYCGVQSSVARIRAVSAIMVMMSPGPALGILDREIAPRCAAHRLDGFDHRIAAAIAAVQGRRRAALLEIHQRRAMRLRQIGDMDEIADAASVLCRIVGPEHIDLGAPGRWRPRPRSSEDALRRRWRDRCGTADRRQRR